MTLGLPPRGRRWAWLGLATVLVGVLALVRVTTVNPRVSVRWDEGLSAASRAALERRHRLEHGSPIEGTATGWQYELGDRSSRNIRALVEDAAVDDTGNIDRDAFTAPTPGIRLTVRSFPFPLNDLFDHPSQLLELHQSFWLMLAGGVLLWAARASKVRARRNVAVVTLLLVGAVAFTFPISPTFVKMGETLEKGANASQFDSYFGGRVRFEKHLSQIILLELYGRIDSTDAPALALVAMSRLGTAWFVLATLAIGFVERWSAVVLRYLALALLAPASLLYFGWQEFGYLSLNVVAFPLLARGLHDGGRRIEAGSAVVGLGAALHGSGLVSLAGALLASLGASAPLKERVGRVLRVAAWGTAAYLGWVAIYVIVLHLRIEPGDPLSAWRPWLVDEIRKGRVSVAIFSARGARDILMEAWVVGAPLLVVAVSLWRRYPHEVRTALWYVPPSILFLIFRWPFQGIYGGLDLVLGGFPALYALAWVCAQDSKRTTIAAAILMSAHLAFWRIALDQRFENIVIDEGATRGR